MKNRRSKLPERKPVEPHYANGGWYCEVYNNQGRLVLVFIPDKED